MKILYLYAELMGYQIPVLEEYVHNYNAEVDVVHWDHKKLTPYILPTIPGINYYKRSEYNIEKLKQLIFKSTPNIVYVSGWMDKDYLTICKILKRNGVPIVAGSDTQWKGTLKQILGILYFRLKIKKTFTYIWVAGPYQYEYARILGFKKNDIVFNCLTADLKLFNKEVKKNKQTKNNRKFLFLGRLEEIKGIDILLEAWANIDTKKGWSLTFIGSGNYKSMLENRSDVKVIDFKQPQELVIEVQKYDCLILPSIKEPWALVIQEMMAAGLPVIASNICGAAPVFIIPDYNGKIFKNQCVESLTNAITQIINMSDDKLYILSENAKKRSQIITPEIVAASFISMINK